MVGRRRWLQGAGQAAAWACLGTFMPAAAPAASHGAGAQRLTLAVSSRRSLLNLPLTVAHERGYFAAEGLAIDWYEPGVGAGAFQALARGVASVAVCNYAQTIAYQARGVGLRSLAMQMRSPQAVLGVSLKTMAHFRDPSDLKGRKVGLLLPSAGGRLVLGMWLHNAGLRLSDVVLVALDDPAELVQAYRVGKLDALCVYDPVVAQLEQRGEIRVVADTRALSGTQGIFGGPMPGCAVCATTEWVSTHPEACQALASGMVQALKWLQTAGPSDLNKTVPEAYFGGDRSLYLAAFEKVREGFSVDGFLPPEAAQVALKTMGRLDHDVRPERIDLAQTYTNDFVLRAKLKYKV